MPSYLAALGLSWRFIGSRSVCQLASFVSWDSKRGMRSRNEVSSLLLPKAMSYLFCSRYVRVKNGPDVMHCDMSAKEAKTWSDNAEEIRTKYVTIILVFFKTVK